jgi:DNA replication protein
MNDNIVKLLNDKHYVFSNQMVKVLDHSMTLNEFLILIYLVNDNQKSFDAEGVSKSFNISLEEVMEAFNSLISKNLIILKPTKDDEGRINDTISLDNYYKLIIGDLNNLEVVSKTKDVFSKIEKEFGRPLSPIECEIINGWLDTGNSEELILGALKEASYNGVKNLRYIDKILYEWGKKGFKTMNDVSSHLKNKDEEKNNQELFDYDWLDDEE